MSSAMKRRSLIIRLARIIRFVVALNKHIKNVMEIIATDSNKVSIMSGKTNSQSLSTIQTLENSQKLWQRKVSQIQENKT